MSRRRRVFGVLTAGLLGIVGLTAIPGRPQDPDPIVQANGNALPLAWSHEEAIPAYAPAPAPDIEGADRMAPLPSAPGLGESSPSATPSFEANQGYRGPAPGGIDALYAATRPGGKGENVRIIDIEFSWNVNHEDLSKARLPGALIPNGSAPCDPYGDDHGTAVLGELVADDNGFGVTGIASGASIGMVNVYDCVVGSRVARAIDVAAAALEAGDVMLIELQTATDLLPVEWWLDVYQAIVRATSAGIIVVEAAGNGDRNLDDPIYGGVFSGARPDSGAIIVGAGAPVGCGTPRSRLYFSNYGSRVDMQGWGVCVATTGYGGLQDSTDPNLRYTSSFNGTSSASPIVAGAAAIVSSVAEASGQRLTPVQVRSLLRDTGTAQATTGLGGHIGPLPNLRAALGGAVEERAVGLTLSTSTDPNGARIELAWTLTSGTQPAQWRHSRDGSDGGWTSPWLPGLTRTAALTYLAFSTLTNVTLEDSDGNTWTESIVTAPPPTPVEPVVTTTPLTLEGNTIGGYRGPLGGATAVDPDDATASLVLTNDAPALLGLGLTTVTWTATDPAGHRGTAAQAVLVRDTTAPILACPADVTAKVGQTVMLGEPAVADIVDGAPTVTNTAPRSFGIGVTEVTWIAGDASGNLRSCVQTVTLTEGLLALLQQPQSGYWMVGEDGTVYAFGDAIWRGNAPAAVDLEPTPSGLGYWIVDADGHVFTFGDARPFGGINGALGPFETVTSISATPAGNGYWLFTTFGRVVAFGDASWLGDMVGTTLNGPVLDSIPTASGHGYYMVASDGGIFTFGDAAFYGSMGAYPLNAPVLSLVPDGDGAGYWLVASDGGIFAFGADFHGSMGAIRLNEPITGMVASGTAGYLMVAEDGGIFAFGDARFEGSLGANPPARPITGVAVVPTG